MSPPVFCPSCERTYFNARPQDLTCPRCGTLLVGRDGAPASRAGARHRLPADTRALRETHVELDRVLADVDADARRKVRFLVTELIAQSIRRDRDNGGGLVELTVEVRDGVVRVEAEGAGVPVMNGNGNGSGANGRLDPLADLALFIVDELAARWGSGEGSEPSVWFEVERRGTGADAG